VVEQAIETADCGVVTPGSPIPTSLVKSNTDISIVDASLGGKSPSVPAPVGNRKHSCEVE
jgi:hypothetical protein